MAKTVLCFFQIAIAFVFFSSLGSAQTAFCNCVFSDRSSKCMPRFFRDTCKTVCKEASFHDLTVLSATGVEACKVEVKPATLPGLLEAIKHSIGHQGAHVYVGSTSDTLLNGRSLQQVLIAVEESGNKYLQDSALTQRRSEIAKASLSDIEHVTDEALVICKTQDVGLSMKSKLFEIWESRTGPYQAKERAYGMYTAAQAKRYQDIRDLNFDVQGDDRFKGLLNCFSGSEIQNMINEFVQKTGVPPLPARKETIKDITDRTRPDRLLFY